MPVYNCERYLDEAIRSIRDQTFTNFEFVIVNDGSKDNSLEIIRRHAEEDSRIVFLNRQNGGIVDALNAGLEVCRGRYIARMDGDDVSYPNRLRQQVDYLDAHPDVVLLGSRVQLSCANGVPLRHRGMFRELGLDREHKAIVDRLLTGFGAAVVHPACMMRRDAIDEVGGYRRPFRWVEDLDLFLRLSMVGQLANLSECLLLYRQQLASTNHTKQEEQKRLALSAIREAARTMGLPEPPDRTMHWKLPNHVTTMHDWTANALLGQRLDAAWLHALAALRMKPISRNTWRNLALCLLCQCGIHWPVASLKVHAD